MFFKKRLSSKNSNIILGLDPGTNVMGFGLIETIEKKTKLVQYGVLTFKRDLSHYEKLQKIYESVDQLILDYAPDEVAIEAPFFGKNVQSMLKLGRAQGVAIAAIIKNGLPVYEYAPKKIKSAVTGNGNATKERVAQMIETFTNVKINVKQLDATDALGAAYCHFFQKNNMSAGGKSYSGWESYVKNNKGRVK